MFTLRLHVPHFICMLVFISLAFSIENKGLQMTDHQDAVMYLHEQHLLHPTNGHCVPITQIKSGHKTENNPKNTQSPKFLQTPLEVTHSARGIEYPLPGFMCRDAHPEICEVWHPWWNYYLVFSPEKNYPIKWWPCSCCGCQEIFDLHWRPGNHIPVQKEKRFGRKVETISDHSFHPWPDPPSKTRLFSVQ